MAMAARGRVLLDGYVRPRGHIFYNTQFLGSTAKYMAAAVSFGKARKRVQALVTANTMMVGTALLFKALQHHSWPNGSDSHHCATAWWR